MDPRFLSLFSAYNVTFPSSKSLHHIYFSIITGHLIPFNSSKYNYLPSKIMMSKLLNFTEIQELAKPITSATMDLYERIVRDLPPTPSKFHYIFNLRDLSRIYHGLFLTTPDRFSEPANFVRVWRNECMRVFFDRLTNDKDKTLVSEHMSELLQQHFASHAEVSKKNLNLPNTM